MRSDESFSTDLVEAGPRHVPLRRFAAALAALTAVGASVGLACGATAGALGALLDGFSGDWRMVASIGAYVSAPIGAVLAPVLGLGPLRRVPLGRAIAIPAATAVVVGVVGFVAMGPVAPLLAAGGAVLAAVGLWEREYRSRAARQLPEA